jgi:hypothetical protein
VADSRRTLAVFLATLGVVYLLAYLGHPLLAGNAIKPEGWWGWWDQSCYLKCTAAIARGVISENTYLYPLGYSLMAVPFYPWTAKHAFFIPDLVFIVGSAWTFFHIARRLLRPIEAYGLMILFVFFYRGMLSDTLVIPWNTIPTHFLIYAIFYFVAFKRPTSRDVYMAIGYLTLLYVFKVVEFICVAPAVAIAILTLRDRREIFRMGSLAAVAIGSVIIAMMIINFAVFGDVRSSYEVNQIQIGAGHYSLLWKVYFLFVSGGPVFRESHPMMLSHAPWLLLIIPGIVCLWQRLGPSLLGVLLSFVLCFGIYASYNDLGPGNLYRSFLIHYFEWMFPLLALITYVGLKEGWRTRAGRWSFGSIPVLLFLVCFVTLRENVVATLATDGRPITIPRSTDQPVDWIHLQGTIVLPPLETNGAPLRYAKDFQWAPGPDGIGILLSKYVTQTKITVTNTKDIQRVFYGQLVWQFGWSPQRLLTEWTRRFTRARVSFLGQQAGLDLAGPSGVPDGVPDQAITVELPGWLMDRIENWEIELPDNRGRWFSYPNVDGAWLITMGFPPELQTKGSNRVIRLCLPDNGYINDTPLIHIRALGPMGELVLEAEVHNNRPPPSLL